LNWYGELGNGGANGTAVSSATPVLVK
jgi:hypothetical protein